MARLLSSAIRSWSASCREVASENLSITHVFGHRWPCASGAMIDRPVNNALINPCLFLRHHWPCASGAMIEWPLLCRAQLHSQESYGPTGTRPMVAKKEFIWQRFLAYQSSPHRHEAGGGVRNLGKLRTRSPRLQSLAEAANSGCAADRTAHF